MSVRGVMDDLSAADAKRVRAGEQVVLTKEVEGKPWPRVTVYQRANASADEAMAVFFDYDNAAKYVPWSRRAMGRFCDTEILSSHRRWRRRYCAGSLSDR